MPASEISQQCRSGMLAAISHLKENLLTIRTGRANAQVLEDLKVHAYDTLLTLKEMATLSTPDPKTIIVHPWDKSVMGEVQKAISQSHLGFSPVVDGDIIRISVPPLTEERRKEFIKVVAQRVEQARISIRMARQEAIQDIRKLETEKEISEDDADSLKKEIEKLNKEMNEEAERIGERKEKELMEV
ncbi:MAG TPA: ribosome recycling factor [Patescibacteria group bacterium]|nr:ribosome recycling factor [Patescibacteria group bacterium]